MWNLIKFSLLQTRITTCRYSICGQHNPVIIQYVYWNSIFKHKIIKKKTIKNKVKITPNF